MRNRQIKDITAEYVDAAAEGLRDNELPVDLRRQLRESGWTIAATATILSLAEAQNDINR